MASSTGQSPHSQVQAQPHDRMTAFGASSSNQPAGHVDTYDPARISQWAAHSATGPPVVPNYGAHDQCNFTYGSDMLSANMASQMPSQFPGSQSGDPNAFHSVPLPGVYGPGTTYNESSTSSAEADFARLGMDHEMAPDPGFGFPSALNGDHYSNVLSSSIDDRSFSTFSPGELPSFDPAEANPPFVIGNGNNGLSLSLPWEASGFDVAQPLEWSPASGLTPSSSSMQSSHSFLGHQPDTPVSAMAYDGVYAVNPRGPLDGDSGMIPPFSLGEAVVPQPSIGFVDPERFAPTTDNLVSFQSDAMPSTIRPSENFQRAPLSMDMWASNDTANQSYGLPVAYNGFDGSRRSSEGEVKNARDHVFYKATTKDDSMYHCPYIATEKCTHKPDKLKCNYDKHLDSHLKPYRCKSLGCSQIQFSSTACLLRHEREAHGMHGHGPKPHLCFFKDCDRAQEDNGFPRRWNLFDHMKRVHDFAGTEPSNKSNSPPPSSSSPEPQMDLPTKKRRTPSPPVDGAAKRTKIATSGQTMEYNSGLQNLDQAGMTQMIPEYQPQSLNQIWYDYSTQVQNRLQNLDPTDPRQWKQYQAETETLRSIGLSIQFQQQGQLAH